MDDPQGLVVSITATTGDREALIEVDAAAVCLRCAQGRGCGALAFASSMKKRRIEATVPADVDVRVGDYVKVALEPRSILIAATIVYGWPLIGAVAGALFAYGLSLGDAAAAASALVGLAVGAACVRQRLSRTRCLRQFTPRIVV